MPARTHWGFRFDGTNVEVVTGGSSTGVSLSGGTVVATHATADIDTLNIVGVDGEDDIAVLDFFGGISSINIVYDGGAGGNDSLEILGGAFDSLVTAFNGADPSAGVITLDDGTNPVSTVDFVGLEPVLLNVGSVTDIIFNLPDADNTGANSVTLSDGAIANDRMMLISGANFEDTIFENPTGSLTINGGSMNDEIIVASFDGRLDAGLVLTGGAGVDSIGIQQGFTVKGLPGASVNAEQVDLASLSARGGSINITGANIDLNGSTYQTFDVAGEDNSITFDGAVDFTNTGLIRISTSGAAGEDVAFTGAVNGPADLDVSGGGSGGVRFDGQVGGTARLDSLTVTGGGGLFVAGSNILTNGTQLYNSAVTVSVDATFDADDADITFVRSLQGVAVGGPDDITIDAGTGQLELNDPVGANNNIDSVDLVAGLLVLDGATATQGALTITASSSVLLNADVDSGSSTSIVVTGDDTGGQLFSLSSLATLRSTAGMLSIQADDMNFVGTVDATGQTVLLRQNSDSEAIRLGVGGSANDTLELSSTEISLIDAAILRIGHTTAGDIEFANQQISSTDIETVSLLTGGAITDSGSGRINVTNLAIQAAGDVTLDDAGSVDALAASITGGGSSFIFANEDDGLDVGSNIDGLTGITTADNTSGDSGSITLSTTSGAINVAQAIRTGAASGATTVTSGSISVTAGSGAIFGSASPQTGLATSNDGGAGSASTGDITLAGSEISDDGAAAASGAFVVSIGSASGGNANTDGSLFATVTGSGDAGEIIVSSANNLSVAALDTANSDTTTVNVAVTTAGNTLTVSNVVDADQDDVTLTADDVTIANGIQGTGTLLLQPLSATRSIGLGGGAGDFNLDDADLGQLTDGFSSITIGRSDGEHIISIDSATFTDPITIQAPNGAGSINVADSGASTSGLVGNGNASITIDGPGATTTLEADIVTSGNAVLISDNVVLSESVSIDTTNGGVVTVGSDVTINGTVEDTNSESNSLTVNGGSSGNVDLQSDIGTVESIAGLTITNAANLNLRDVTVGSGSSVTQIAGTGTTTIDGDIATSGAGSVSLTTSGNIVLVSGSSLTTVDGGISLNANAVGATAGDFVGIVADNVTIQSTGTGDIALTGSGGDDAGTGSHIGVLLHNGTSVSSTLAGATAGTIGIVGTGGDGTSDNAGVDITDATTIVQSVGGDISIVGSGASGSGAGNHGVIVQNAGSVSSTGSAGVAITGSATTGNDIELNTSGNIGGGTAAGDITLTADTVVLAGAVNVQSSGALTIVPRTAATAINLGTGATDTGLQLDDTELALLADGFSSITIGDATSGTGNVNIDNATFVDDVTIVGGTIAVTRLTANDTVDNGDGTGLRAVTLTARTGAITDGGDTGTDVTSGDLVVTSATGIGISTDAIDTTVARLEAVGGTGGVFVSNSADLSVGGISATDGVSASNADISITATGTLTITEAVSSGGGNVALTASNGVTLTGAAADVITNGGAYTVDADSNDDASGSYAQDDADSAVTTTGGTVSVTAADIALVGSLSAGVGIVLLAPSTAASIGLGGAAGAFNLTDAEADRITASRLEIGISTSGAISVDDFSPVNVTTLVLNTDEGVSEGTGDAGIDLSVTNLAIESDTGVDIDANVTTLAINNADAASNVQIDSTSASLTIGSVTTAAGVLSGITTADGSITVAGATAIIVDNAVTANGGGISLTTSTGDLTINADILAATAGTESVVLNAGDDVLLNVGTVQSIGTGDFRIDAGTSTGTGVFTMAAGTLLDSSGGSLIIDADGDVTLAEIDHQSVGATDDVTIISTGGSITLLAGEGGLVATAGASVNLDADSGVTLNDATTVDTAGTVTVDADVDNDGTGTLTTSATGTISAATGDIQIIAADAVLAGAITSSGALTLLPSTTGSTIGVGGGAGSFNISDAEILILTDGFSSITIGDLTGGTGAVDVDSSTFVDVVTIVGGAIAVTALVGNDTAGNGDGTGLQAVTLTARTGDITDGENAGATDVTGSLITLNAEAGAVGEADGVGNDALELAATTLVTDSTDGANNGAQFLAEADNLLWNSSSAGSGTITIISGIFNTGDGETITGSVVTDGATLAGRGTVTGSVVTNSGGTIAPGFSPGILNTGDLTLNAGSTLAIEFEGDAGAGVELNGHDQVNVTGTVDVTDATLTVDVTDLIPSEVNVLDEFVIINNDGGDAVTGTFDGFAENSVVATDLGGTGLVAIIHYAAGDGNDVTIEVVGAFFEIIGNDAVYTDQSGLVNTLTMTRVLDGGTNYVQLTDASTVIVAGNQAGVEQVNANAVRIDVAQFSGDILVNTNAAADSLTIDYSGTGGVFTKNVVFDGGNPTVGAGDSLALTGNPAEFATVTYDFDNVSDGSIDVDGVTIDYFDLEADLKPITADISAANVILNYSAAAETIAVSDATGGRTLADSGAGESLTFTNPTSTLTINAGDTGVNTVNVGSLAASYPASIVVNGGDGGDTVNLNGTIGFAADRSLTVDAEIINAPNTGSDITTSGMGSVSLTAAQNIVLSTGSSITTVNGGITLDANSAGTTAGNFTGISASGATLQSTGSGNISLTGQGAVNGNTDADQRGVLLQSSTMVTSTGTGTITLNGTGGDGTSNNDGVYVLNSTVQSASGNIDLTGVGGAGDSVGNRGVFVENSSVASTGTATVTLMGTGGNGTSSNHGVDIAAATTVVTSLTGNMQITGVANGTTTLNRGVLVRGPERVSVRPAPRRSRSTGQGETAPTKTLESTFEIPTPR